MPKTYSPILVSVLFLWAITACQKVYKNKLATDHSPHREYTLTVNGAKLEYLDWGGTGPDLLLISGLGNSAHIFDDLAPQLSENYHVLGLSRRAHGRSEVTPTGYGLDTLVADLKAFTENKGLEKVILMGHSFGGLELTRFAQLYPNKVKALIYLEAAYDYRQISTLWAFDPIPVIPGPADIKNIRAHEIWFKKHFGFWSAALETDNRIVYEKSDGTLRFESMPQKIMNKYVGTLSTFGPDYRSFTFPVLAFFAQTREHPYIQSSPDSLKVKANQYWESVFLASQKRSINLLKNHKPDARVVIMPNAKHLCFIREQDQLLILNSLKNLTLAK